jgi:hypothetical protein
MKKVLLGAASAAVAVVICTQATSSAGTPLVLRTTGIVTPNALFAEALAQTQVAAAAAEALVTDDAAFAGAVVVSPVVDALALAAADDDGDLDAVVLVDDLARVIVTK